MHRQMTNSAGICELVQAQLLHKNLLALYHVENLRYYYAFLGRMLRASTLLDARTT